MMYTQEFVETLYIEVKNLQKKVEQLEVQGKQLTNDNSRFKAALNQKSQFATKDRSLVSFVDPIKYDYLFDFDVSQEGNIISSVSAERKNTNFTNLYRSLLLVLKPTAKCSNGQKNKFYIKNPNLYELTDKEYKIFGNYLVKVLDSLIEVKEDLRKETENE